jgi:hypothetical protein
MEPDVAFSPGAECRDRHSVSIPSRLERLNDSVYLYVT